MNNIPSSFLLKNKRFASLIGCINSIQDPRKTSLHPFGSVIIIALCAMLAGANDFTAIEEFSKTHRKWFKKFLNLPYGIPAHDTFNDIFAKILPGEFKKLMYWLNQTIKKDKFFKKDDNPIFEIIDQICIDGKVLRGFKSRKKLIIEHAWSITGGMIIDQLRILADEGEISTIPKLLTKLNLKNKVVTIDAIGTQKKIVDLIVRMGGFYLLALKGNQHNFYKDVKDFMDSLRKGEFKDEPVKVLTHQTVDKGHGRIETRKIWATTSVAWLEQKKEWKNLKTIIVVESTVIEKEKTSIEHRYFISNLELDAETLLSIIRNHWSIESKCHWVLNTTFSERRSNLRKGFAPENMSVLRKICLKLIAMIISKLSFKNKRAKAAVDFEYLLKLLVGEDIDTRSNFEKIFDFGNKLIFELFSFATTVF